MATANGDGLDGVGLRKDMDTMELMENGDGDALHVALVLCGAMTKTTTERLVGCDVTESLSAPKKQSNLRFWRETLLKLNSPTRLGGKRES